MINRVTITGADDSIQPKDLLYFSEKYPFVEWAILVSKNQTGFNRFPTINWIEELTTLSPKMNLSLHLCGSYVRDLLMGEMEFINNLQSIWKFFNRVQINTHGEDHSLKSDFFKGLKIFPEKQWIFQYDQVNVAMLHIGVNNGLNCSALFDLSHGAGILPKEWPNLLPGVKCGYAGGISPTNIESQIIRVNEKVGSNETWIDMETHVRSSHDQLFDLDKVEECLTISSKYISQVSQSL